VDIPRIIDVARFEDERGWFEPWFVHSERLELDIKQVNFNKTFKNAFRGFHFGIGPKAQGKYISCLRGEILDFALDVRINSKDFGKLYRFELSGNVSQVAYIPMGFAHGMYGVSNESLVVYAASEVWVPSIEVTISPFDADLSLGLDLGSLICTEKDRSGLSLQEYQKTIFKS